MIVLMNEPFRNVKRFYRGIRMKSTRGTTPLLRRRGAAMLYFVRIVTLENCLFVTNVALFFPTSFELLSLYLAC